MKAYQYITADPNTLGGKPVITGTRISVSLIMEWLATGASPAEIADKHPLMTEEMVVEAIRYATRFLQKEVVIEAKKPE